MSCGCKNKTQTQSQPQQQQATTQLAKEQQNESVKAAIKKTVEKYYNVNKTSK
jgi:hypothetical protein